MIFSPALPRWQGRQAGEFLGQSRPCVNVTGDNGPVPKKRVRRKPPSLRIFRRGITRPFMAGVGGATVGTRRFPYSTRNGDFSPLAAMPEVYTARFPT